MSEYAGELKVKIVPDTSGFATQLQGEMRQASPRVQALMDRTGVTKQLSGIKAVTADLNRENLKLAAGQDATAASARGLARGMGLVGIAGIAGYQAIQQLRQGLQVTGAEAGTTEGRFRNLGASLLGGDVIGAFKAVRVEFTLAATALQSLQAEIARGDTTNLTKLAEAAKVFGSSKLSEQLSAAQFQVRANLKRDDATAASLTPGLRDDLKVAQDAEAEAKIGIRVFEKGTEAYSKAFSGFAQAVKARRAIVENIEKNNATPEARDAGRSTQYQLNLLRAQGSKSEKDDLAIQNTRREFLEKQISVLERNTSKTSAERSRLVTLYGQLEQIETSIDSTREQARQAAQERLQKRLAFAQTELSIQLANARGEGQETAAIRDQAAFASKEANDKRLSVEQRQGFELQAAQLNKQLFDIGQASAERAKQAAADALAQKQQEIAAEKERYRAGLSLQEQRLQLSVQAAQLTTKNLKDDKKAIRAEIAFYKEREKDKKLSIQERLTAQSNKISAQLQLKSLASQQADRTGGGQSRFDFFKQAGQNFRDTGSNIAKRDGILSGQDARASFAARVLTSSSAQAFAAAVAQAQARRDNARLTEAQRQTAVLRNIARGVNRAGRHPVIRPSIQPARTVSRVVPG